MQAPKAGTLYVSALDSSVRVFVEDVSAPDAEGFFVVSTCDPAAHDDMQAPGIEFAPDEWHALCHRLILRPE